MFIRPTSQIRHHGKFAVEILRTTKIVVTLNLKDRKTAETQKRIIA